MGSYSNYLQGTLGQVLIKCLADVSQVRPIDPIEYMAQWLYKQADAEIYFYEKDIFRREMEKVLLGFQKEHEKRRHVVKLINDKMEQIQCDIQRQKLEQFFAFCKGYREANFDFSPFVSRPPDILGEMDYPTDNLDTTRQENYVRMRTLANLKEDQNLTSDRMETYRHMTRVLQVALNATINKRVIPPPPPPPLFNHSRSVQSSRGSEFELYSDSSENEDGPYFHIPEARKTVAHFAEIREQRPDKIVIGVDANTEIPEKRESDDNMVEYVPMTSFYSAKLKLQSLRAFKIGRKEGTRSAEPERDSQAERKEKARKVRRASSDTSLEMGKVGFKEGEAGRGSKERDLSRKGDEDRDLSKRGSKDEERSRTGKKDRDSSSRRSKDRDPSRRKNKDRDSSKRGSKDRDSSKRGSKDKELSRKGSKDRDSSKRGSKDKERSRKGSKDRDPPRRGSKERDLSRRGDEDRDLSKRGSKDRDLSKRGSKDRDLSRRDSKRDEKTRTRTDREKGRHKSRREKRGRSSPGPSNYENDLGDYANDLGPDVSDSKSVVSDSQAKEKTDKRRSTKSRPRKSSQRRSGGKPRNSGDKPHAVTEEDTTDKSVDIFTSSRSSQVSVDRETRTSYTSGSEVDRETRTSYTSGSEESSRSDSSADSWSSSSRSSDSSDSTRKVLQCEWSLEKGVQIVCQHPILGAIRSMHPRPLGLLDSPHYWFSAKWSCQVIYDPELYTNCEELEQPPVITGRKGRK